MNAIKIKNVSYSYPDGIEVFRNISFVVDDNESIGIVGPNGAGKTTLLLILSGLVKSKGDIYIDGELKTDKNIGKIRKKMSFVFQNPDDQLFMPRVIDDILFGLDKLGFSEEKISESVDKVLKMVGLMGFEERSSHHLSLGQKKRVCLASAFARNPKILLLDEPSNELDPEGRKNLIGLIKIFKGTKLIVSHDLNMISEICDKVIVLNNKKIVAFGKTGIVLGDRNLMESNSLEVPYNLLKR